MADRVDRYFSDYYSGVFEAEIKNAKKSISERDSNGDKMRLAHYEEEVFIIENFLNTISDEDKKIMSMRLDRRKKKSWIELSSIMMQSETNLRRKFKAVKTSFENNFLGIEIKKPQKFVEMTAEQKLLFLHYKKFSWFSVFLGKLNDRYNETYSSLPDLSCFDNWGVSRERENELMLAWLQPSLIKVIGENND